MEGFIARWYAKNTAKSRSDFAADARRVSAQLAPGARVLEVAPGPGYFAIELARLGNYRITGLDISRSFIEMARSNAAAAGISAEFVLGSASAMPLDSGQYDFLFCRAAFKNFSVPVRALEEMYRVLAPGGRALIADLRRDAPPAAIDEAVSHMGLGAVSAWLTRRTFHSMLLKRAYTQAEFECFLNKTHFSSTSIEENSIAMDIWLTK